MHAQAEILSYMSEAQIIWWLQKFFCSLNFSFREMDNTDWLIIDQASVVERVDIAIHWLIAIWWISVSKTDYAIHWIYLLQFMAG